MNEVEKMYKNAGFIRKQCKDYSCTVCEQYKTCEKYPPFTAEKQIEIENVILQNKKNRMKWIQYSINAHGKWVIGFVDTNCRVDVVVLEDTRTEALAHIINNLWQDLTEEERKQIKEILE